MTRSGNAPNAARREAVNVVRELAASFGLSGDADQQAEPVARQAKATNIKATNIKETLMDRPKCEDAIAAKGRPFTGAEYLESLRDGREVYVYGERVKDVTTHPAFRNAARSIARLYDALHDAKTRELLVCSDRYRLGRLYPQILPGRSFARGRRRPA